MRINDLNSFKRVYIDSNYISREKLCLNSISLIGERIRDLEVITKRIGELREALKKINKVQTETGCKMFDAVICMKLNTGCENVEIYRNGNDIVLHFHIYNTTYKRITENTNKRLIEIAKIAKLGGCEAIKEEVYIRDFKKFNKALKLFLNALKIAQKELERNKEILNIEIKE